MVIIYDSTMIAELYAVCERRDDVRAQWVGAEMKSEQYADTEMILNAEMNAEAVC